MEKLRTEAEIIKNWQGDITKPLVSIGCITYNHEKYIRDALEGFLIQKTDFPFQICILDDASTDDNVKIIQEYAEKYPRIFKCFFLKENTWGKPYRIERAKPYLDARDQAKYIAYCEGDDYWIDPLKLQKQIDYLEENPTYGLVHTDVNIKYEKNNKIISNYNKETNIKLLGNNAFEEILSFEYPIQTCTTCLRTELIQRYHYSDKKRSQFQVGDTPIWMDLAMHSNVRYIDESMAVRRIIEESASQTKNITKKINFIKSVFSARMHYIDKYDCSTQLKKIVQIKYNKKMLKYGYHYTDKAVSNNAYKELKDLGYIFTFDDYMFLIGSKNHILKLFVKIYFKINKILKK